ncbi:MAG: HDIG domain-containing protein [Bacteroidales bacterium]|nr:HDIG domain-containing protein [Bacteroidales bacterium]
MNNDDKTTLQGRTRQTLHKLARFQSNAIKIVMMLAVSALIPLMFPSSGQSSHYDYSIGGIWRNNDLVAPYDFAVSKTQADISHEIDEAMSKCILYYTVNTQAHSQAVANMDSLAKRHPQLYSRQYRKTLDSIYNIGYLEMPADMPDFENRSFILLEGNMGTESYTAQYVTPISIKDTLLRDSILVPDLQYDATRTQLELDSRLSQLSTSAEMIKQGTLIIAKGDQVSRDQANIIAALEAENDNRFQENFHPWGRYLGALMLCVIAFLALYMFLKNVRHELLDDNRKVAFVMTLILLMSGITALVTAQDPSWVLVVPLCIVPIMMRMFFDMRVALYVHVTIIVILANMVPNPFEFIFYQLIAGMMSIVTVRSLERRSKFFLVCLVIFITYSLIYTFGVLSQESTLNGISFNRYLSFFINALLTLLAYPLIYIFEKLFQLTTNLTLMELSSTNNPVLRELSRKASGTFQHSVQVANLSEDVVSELGGNTLLAKVGALYHDIGKLKDPNFFTENQTNGFNPHDDLDNYESAELVTGHVTYGLMLAKKYNLPSDVADFIRTHHGTTLTGYFYHQEKQLHPDEEVPTAKFSYCGPTPFSRETAVVMIVDSVEAACKSIKNYEEETINKLVDAIIDGKIKENQFENCDLTFGDITRIRQMLKAKMASIYHARISYPTTK